jgi:hypothetical protein
LIPVNFFLLIKPLLKCPVVFPEKAIEIRNVFSYFAEMSIKIRSSNPEDFHIFPNNLYKNISCEKDNVHVH